MLVEILKPMRIQKEHCDIGAVVQVDDKLARNLIFTKAAKKYVEPEKVIIDAPRVDIGPPSTKKKKKKHAG